MNAEASESLLDDLRVIVEQAERIKAALEVIDPQEPVLIQPDHEEVCRAFQNTCESLERIKCRSRWSWAEATAISNRLIERWAKKQPQEPLQ